jgi:ABC-2 type transport system permease protein
VVLFIAIVGGTIPFALLGLTIGYLVPASSAPGIVNTIYLPLGFLSGLWIPLEMLPEFMRTIAQWLPAFHLGQLAVGLIGMPVRASLSSHLVALLGFSVIFAVTAVFAYQKDRVNNYA